MIKEAISLLVDGGSLSREDAAAAMDEIMSGAATASQIASFLTAMRIKGETAEEIAGFASAMRDKAMPVKLSGPAIDIVGTGGDGSGSFNLSTAAAFVAAGAGLRVAKHGNRAASSRCGSADVLEALGVKIDLDAEGVARCIEEAGMGFMFATVFHPAMKYAAPTRREMGIRTVFNILGPLTNPARAEYLVLGVPGEQLGGKIAAVLQKMGTRHSLVVCGLNGMDEISVSGGSLVWEVTSDKVAPPREITPRDFGFEAAGDDAVKGGAPEENAAALRRVLNGEKSALRNAVVMNAAAAMVAGELSADLAAGARLAEDAIDSGKAREKLAKLVELSQSLG